MSKLTACIIAKNEEATIERALKSLSFADEIVVIDSFSTDQTLSLSKKYTNAVYQNQFKGFSDQRNFALSKCSGDWVFFLDADEETSPELGFKLKQIAIEPEEQHPHCYSIKRVEYFLGKELNYGPGNPSHQWRYFKKNKVRFEGHVHEFPRFDGGVGKIDFPIFHNPNLGIDRFLTKLNHYTTLEALDRFSQGQRTSLLHIVGTFLTTFFKNGIRYGGFLNGREGFILVLLESFSRVVRHMKLWLYWQIHEGRISIKLPYVLPQPGSSTGFSKQELEKPISNDKKI